MKFEEYMEWIEKHGKPEPDLFTITCSNCGESILYEDMIEMDGYGFVCSDCLLEEFKLCKQCDSHVHNDEWEKGEGMCKTCYNTPPIQYVGIYRR